MVSVERVQQYTKLYHEADLEILDSKPKETWPERGQITCENVVFRYHPSLPPVLKGISFNIKPKEKVLFITVQKHAQQFYRFVQLDFE